jgi:hypothetical protein
MVPDTFPMIKQAVAMIQRLGELFLLIGMRLFLLGG